MPAFKGPAAAYNQRSSLSTGQFFRLCMPVVFELFAQMRPNFRLYLILMENPTWQIDLDTFVALSVLFSSLALLTDKNWTEITLCFSALRLKYLYWAAVFVLRNSASSFHRLSISYLHCSVVRRPASVTPPLISTIWCFRPYKPYIFCEDMILVTCQCQHMLSWAQFTVV